MDTRWRSYSHSSFIKIIVFIMVIVCFTGAISTFISVVKSHHDDFNAVIEDSYFGSSKYIREATNVIGDLTRLIGKYKSQEHILNEGTITEDQIRRLEESLFLDFKHNSSRYDHNLGNVENYNNFKDIYADTISQAKDKLVSDDLEEYNRLLQSLSEYEGIIYYASDGVNTYANSTNVEKDYFMSYPSYILYDKDGKEAFPAKIQESNDYLWFYVKLNKINKTDDVVYISFTKEYIDLGIEEWKESKEVVTNGLYKTGWFILGLLLSFIYLSLVIGRNGFKDKEVYLNSFDRLYTDINLFLCLGLIFTWFLSLQAIDVYDFYEILIPVTTVVSTLGLLLVLSLIKHVKNGTVLKHSLIYNVFYRIFKFFKDLYDSGSVGVKIVIIVIGYPLIAALTFFIFPITLGVAGWLALKKVKEFNTIKEGVDAIKNGEIYHTIDVQGKGEFGKLASNINSITEGLSKAVDNELKSERLKTELITNVSHDIRTPLTSIITYIDLLKTEQDPLKAEEYIQIIDQKAQRLKILTDDLFEAAKATSGSIPVNYEKIDIVSLITQGFGELNDRIKESKLEFKINKPEEKIYVSADGKLLWRAVENLLSNIFKYSLKGSRVYIDIDDLGSEVIITIKNVSAYELNISADELMERFKRGDESRSSQGSGLGLSIAKSLIEMQKGRFRVEIDGDLFKAMIQIPKHKENN